MRTTITTRELAELDDKMMIITQFGYTKGVPEKSVKRLARAASQLRTDMVRAGITKLGIEAGDIADAIRQNENAAR